MKKRWLLVALLLMSPGIWNLAKQPGEVINEWRKWPEYARQSQEGKKQNPYQGKVEELRWGGRELHRESKVMKIIYNPGMTVVNEFFEFWEFATPKFFFLAGDGGRFSPIHTEPINLLLFPFWAVGCWLAIKKGNIKAGIWLTAATAVGYWSGKKEMSMLLPLALWYIYTAYKGLISFKESRYYNQIVGVVLAYGVYIDLIWLWRG
jgi:hypothetical protein